MKYVKIEHRNSNRRRRQNLNAFRGTLSIQLIRSDDGEPLKHVDSSAVRRSFQSKYRPHVGLKQLAKMS